MLESIPVGLGELKGATRPDQVLVCYGLGSCIGLTLYDPVVRVGAMAHVVLPNSRSHRGLPSQPGKYADTAVPAVLNEVLKLGAVQSRLIVRMAGGARMLPVDSNQLDIGARNAEAVRLALIRHGLRLKAEDAGGDYGRTLQLYIGSGKLLVSTATRGEWEL